MVRKNSKNYLARKLARSYSKFFPSWCQSRLAKMYKFLKENVIIIHPLELLARKKEKFYLAREIYDF